MTMRKNQKSGKAPTRPRARRRRARKWSAFRTRSVAVRGCTVSCSRQLAWRSTTTAARVWERRAGRAERWWCARWSRVAQLYLRQCLGARSTTRARKQEGAAEWEKSMLEFADGNFNDAGIEVRSMDQRDRQVGLFGDFLDRVGHGKFVEWRADEESGGLYKLEMVTQVHAACPA